MPELVTTLSGESSNSLVDVEQADRYFDESPGHAEWCGLDYATKCRGLIGASRGLDELDLSGQPTVETQALAFPRVWFPSSDGLSLPREVFQAVCEQALVVAKAIAAGKTGESRRTQLQREGVTSFRLGDNSETFSGGGASQATSAAALAQFTGRAQRLLGPWIRKGYELDSGRYPGAGNPYDHNGLYWPAELR